MQLGFLMSKSPVVPSNSTICLGNAPKRPQNLRKLAANSPKPRTSRILGYVAQNAIPRALSPPTGPNFCGFHPRRIAQTDAETPIAHWAVASCKLLEPK